MVPSILQRLDIPERLLFFHTLKNHEWISSVSNKANYQASTLFISLAILSAMELRKRAAEEKTGAKDQGFKCECSDIVTGLILCGVPQFTKVMPVSDGVVSIPGGFVLEHRDMIGGRVVLEPEDGKGRMFEVVLTTRMAGITRLPALLFGAGWEKFRLKSRVQEGDLLIFALVRASQFVVYILRGHYEIAKKAMASFFDAPDPSARSQARQPSNPNRTLVRDATKDEPRPRPYFERRLHANAFKSQGKRGRHFEFPQAFLRLHANAVGDTVQFVVSSTRQVWQIESFTYGLTSPRRVFLSTGWVQFLEDNKFQQGDVLAITLIAYSKFLVERASDS